MHISQYPKSFTLLTQNTANQLPSSCYLHKTFITSITDVQGYLPSLSCHTGEFVLRKSFWFHNIFPLDSFSLVRTVLFVCYTGAFKGFRCFFDSTDTIFTLYSFFTSTLFHVVFFSVPSRPIGCRLLKIH